ncbi:hypothetical protein HanPSC8_Chr07g0299191 [Helianthus annuus]|nr:hypothetical protein HanPSC8_Chr07g0299191 [Helianthus annuus]
MSDRRGFGCLCTFILSKFVFNCSLIGFNLMRIVRGMHRSFQLGDESGRR